MDWRLSKKKEILSFSKEWMIYHGFKNKND